MEPSTERDLTTPLYSPDHDANALAVEVGAAVERALATTINHATARFKRWSVIAPALSVVFGGCAAIFGLRVWGPAQALTEEAHDRMAADSVIYFRVDTLKQQTTRNTRVIEWQGRRLELMFYMSCVQMRMSNPALVPGECNNPPSPPPSNP